MAQNTKEKKKICLLCLPFYLIYLLLYCFYGQMLIMTNCIPLQGKIRYWAFKKTKSNIC